MKKNYLGCVIMLALFTISSMNAQKSKTEIKKKVLDEQGNLSLVTFTKESNLSISQAKALLKEDLEIENSSFKEIKFEKDKIGFTHEKQQQYYKGLKVEFGESIFHSKSGIVSSASGKVFKVDKEDLTPSISKSTGLQKAMTHVGASTYLWEEENTIGYKKPEGELVILPIIKGVTNKSRLVYKYDVYSQSPLYRADVYVDAQTGEIVFENNRIHHTDSSNTGVSLYNGTVSFTGDLTSGTYSLESSQFETYDMNESTNYNSAASVTSSSSYFTGSTTAVQAHWGAEETYDYYLSEHGRDSYDDSGSVIKSYVSYDEDYVNAFWDGSRMTYGDGDGTTYGPLVALDIVGHELTHGVTEYSAALVYSYESGALNESFSDIFGESIEFYAQGSNDWLMGDQIGMGGSGGALRSLSNPNTYSQPDTYYGTNWYTGSGDSGGVHYNSGVQNFWFYLLSTGGSGTNDNGDAYTVSSIGLDAAGAIAYRNLTVYLTSSSQYSDARTGAIQAAIDLYGDDSTEVIAVTNAWFAVGVGDAYGEDEDDEDEDDDSSDLTYCDSSGSNSSYEWIDYVSFGGMTNTTGNDGGYADYTSNAGSVTLGSTNTIVISAGFRSASYTEYWTVWIDYNQDGTFDDDEENYLGSSSSSSNLSTTIAIPSTATAGTTRMRVTMKYNSAATACETFSYGEVEDYTLTIANTLISTEDYTLDIADTKAIGEEENSIFKVYPNPATNFIKVSLPNSEVNGSYQIINTIGQLVKQGTLKDEYISVSNLSKGVYILNINDGQKNFISRIIKQ